jgi:hypothetical protein
MTLPEMRKRLWGRKVRPLALAVALATALGAVATLAGGAVAWTSGGQVHAFTGAASYLVGSLSAAVSAVMWWAWWARSEKLLLWGLRWSSGVFAASAVLLAADGVWFSAGLSMCWVVAIGGSWLIERQDGARRGK